MAITNGYCTLAELQEKIGNSDHKLKFYLEKCIEDASRLIDTFTGSFFYSKSINITIDQYGIFADGIEMNSYGDKIHFGVPIISITSITEDGSALVENTDFYVYGNNRFIARNGVWSADRQAVVIVGSIGYASVPDDIRRVCLEIAGVLTGKEVRAAIDSDGDAIEVLKNSVQKWAWQILKKYRVIPI